jgi:hypothetical protein
MKAHSNPENDYRHFRRSYSGVEYPGSSNVLVMNASQELFNPHRLISHFSHGVTSLTIYVYALISTILETPLVGALALWFRGGAKDPAISRPDGKLAPCVYFDHFTSMSYNSGDVLAQYIRDIVAQQTKRRGIRLTQQMKRRVVRLTRSTKNRTVVDTTGLDRMANSRVFEPLGYYE